MTDEVFNEECKGDCRIWNREYKHNGPESPLIRKNKMTDEILKAFDEKFPHTLREESDIWSKGDVNPHKVKSFLSQTIQSIRLSTLEEVEGVLPRTKSKLAIRPEEIVLEDYKNEGFDKCLNQIKSNIKELKTKGEE